MYNLITMRLNLVHHLKSLRKCHVFHPKGTTPEGQRLNKEVAQRLEDLNSQMQDAILVQEQSGVRRPANTFAGKMDQVHQWMNNPSSDPSGLGRCPIQCVCQWVGIPPYLYYCIYLCDGFLFSLMFEGLLLRAASCRPFWLKWVSKSMCVSGWMSLPLSDI